MWLPAEKTGCLEARLENRFFCCAGLGPPPGVVIQSSPISPVLDPMASPDKFDEQRQFLSQLLPVAVSQLWPKAKFGCSFTTESGFGCDVDLGSSRLSPTDFDRIESQIKQMLIGGQTLKYELADLKAAGEAARKAGQEYWAELVDLARQSADQLIPIESSWLLSDDSPGATYRVVWDDELAGFGSKPGLETIGDGAVYRLTKLSGAYWRGDANRPQLQRLEGVAFATQDNLNKYLADQESARSRDHRQIGHDQDLFMGSELIGAGLPLWLPDGATVRRELENFVIEEELAAGYQHVVTPDIAQLDLYKQSGHYDLYRDSMYAPIEIDGRQFMLRPMTCPHHFQIYNHRPRSYRELPIRLAEIAKNYRYEQSGELLGLMRLRSFTLADAHIICRPDQASSEVNGALNLIDLMARTLGLVKGQHYSYRLSLHKAGDSGKYFNDPDAWQQSEGYLRQVLQSRGEDFAEVADEAAFYGPKIDVQMVAANGKEDTAFTVQYDFLAHKRFNLHYITAENTPADVVVIHRSSIGCIERFLAFFLEHCNGCLPLWLSPRQLRLLLVGNDPDQRSLAERIAASARQLKIRVAVDDSDESLGKKVRRAQTDLVACQVVIGDKEARSGQVAAKWRLDLVDPGQPPADQPQLPDQLLASLQRSIQQRSLKIPADDD